MLTGTEKPDAGEIRIGKTVEIAYVDQSRETLNDANTVWQEISGGQDILRIGDYELQSRAYCGRFNFKGTEQQKHIGQLSGGERNRVHLAKVLLRGGNVLFLDEPTNDLDVETLRALEEAGFSVAADHAAGDLHVTVEIKTATQVGAMRIFEVSSGATFKLIERGRTVMQGRVPIDPLSASRSNAEHLSRTRSLNRLADRLRMGIVAMLNDEGA